MNKIYNFKVKPAYRTGKGQVARVKEKKRFLTFATWYLTLGFLIFVCTSCDQVYRLLHKQGAQEKELIGEATPLERNPTVEEIQTLLKLYGYNPGDIDGVLGLKTRKAIAEFQRENDLEISRFVDLKTWEKLSFFKKNSLIINSKLNVILVQKILKQQGIDPGTIDGKFGPKTEEAVKKFQSKHGLKVDGKVGYKTLSVMAEFL